MATPLTSKMGDVWVQKTPGQASDWLGACVDLGDIAEPTGDQTLIQCRDRNGNFETIGATEAAPGPVTTTIKRLEFNDKSVLDDIKNCRVTVYGLQRTCGQAGIFAIQKGKGKILQHARVNTRTYSGVAAREDAPSEVTLDISAYNPLYKVWEIIARRQTIAETTNLNDIAFCNPTRCEGDCGAAREAGTDGFIGGDAPAGSPSAKADVWQTEDGGAIWWNVLGGAAHPFAVAEDINSITCFPMDATTTRWIVARGPSGALHAQVAISDDNGATWMLVTVGTTDGEGAAAEGALFSHDRDHIYFATNMGNIYVSDDAGVTWTVQATALTASSGNSLNVVKFAPNDYENGWACGDDDTLIQTTDAGETWEAVVPPTATDDLTGMHVFSRDRIIIGTDSDELYETWDGFDSADYLAQPFTGQGTTGTIAALDFANHLIGFMLHNPLVGQGYVHYSIDGGHIWQRLDTPANSGLNATAVIDENSAFVVGNANGGTGFVCKISA